MRDAAQHADLVTFSGDKLLGGVQAGCIVGRADLVARIRRNPLARALRLGKLSIAALEAVLRLYLHPERLAERLPALRLLTRPQPDIEAAAHRLQPALADALGPCAHVRVATCSSEIGSGALPLRTLPSACLAITRATPGAGHGRWLERVATGLRRLPTPVIAASPMTRCAWTCARWRTRPPSWPSYRPPSRRWWKAKLPTVKPWHDGGGQRHSLRGRLRQDTCPTAVGVTRAPTQTSEKVVRVPALRCGRRRVGCRP